MIQLAVSEWAHNKPSFGGWTRGLAGGTFALIFFSAWSLGVTGMVSVRAACGQDGSLQADRQFSQERPEEQAADSKEAA